MTGAGRRRTVSSIRLSLLMLIGLSAAAPASAQLTVELYQGIEQNRDFQRDAFWTRQWVRSLPPDGAPYLMVVQGPEAWLVESGATLAPALVAERSQPQIARLREAMRVAGLLGPSVDPLVAAGRVVALLRPLSLGGVPAARHARLWQTWEVLADAVHADTLSAAWSAVNLLREEDVAARLALYPTAGGVYFGVWLDRAEVAREPTITGSWVYPSGDGWLLPLITRPPPRQPLASRDVRRWPWQEVADAASLDAFLGRDVPAPRPEAPSPAAADPRLVAAPPEICRQAEALGLRCRPPGPLEELGVAAHVLLALTLVALLGWGFLGYRRYRARIERVALRKREERRESW